MGTDNNGVFLGRMIFRSMFEEEFKCFLQKRVIGIMVLLILEGT